MPRYIDKEVQDSEVDKDYEDFKKLDRNKKVEYVKSLSDTMLRLVWISIAFHKEDRLDEAEKEYKNILKEELKRRYS